MSVLAKTIDCVSKLVDRVVDLEQRVKRLERRIQAPNSFQGWPENEPKRYNACREPCDAWNGPCACGAWHHNGQ